MGPPFDIQDYSSSGWPLIVAAIIGTVYYYYVRSVFSYWARKGIKGPTAWPLFGNFIQLLFNDRMKQQREWPKKYGKVYGVYRGTRPNLFVADAEVLQQICVKDFDVFTNHEAFEFDNYYQKSFLFFQKDEHWKKSRALVTPTFTSGKIKRMFRLLDSCADDLVACFHEQLPSSGHRQKGGEEVKNTAKVNVKDIYNLYTIDAITTCCYGLKLDRAAGSKDLKTAYRRSDFVKMIMDLFEQSMWRILLAIVGPKPLLRWLNFNWAEESKFAKVAATMKQMIEKRKISSKTHDDYLQTLIDAGLDKEADQTNDLPPRRRLLTEHEVVSAATFLLLVSLEETAAMLTHCSYLLAFHPEIQEKLCEEMKKIVEYRENDSTKTYFSFEALMSCQYLDSVISETLRFFTPVFNMERVASRNYRIEKYNLDIPKGTLVSTAFYAIMNDPDYWPEPEKFDPERFMPGNKEKIVPGSYCPFGIGPRHCLGMRFSLTESKLALAKIIMNFRFEPIPGAKFSARVKEGYALANISDPVVVMISRNQNDITFQNEADLYQKIE